MPLKTYQKKRDFKKTKEPKGKKGHTSKKPIFAIQKHDASHLHYDLRLEIDGVLKSWAIPKGPSLNPKEKRLAVETENHPLEYANFEGIIPEGEYGGGTVMLWDKGTFKNLKGSVKDLKKQWENGHLEIWLKGKKLEGGYALTVFRKETNKRQWLLIKMKDDKADARKKPVSSQPKSVKTNRTMNQIRKDSN